MNSPRHPYVWLTGAAAAAFLGAAPAHALPPTVRGPYSPGQSGYPEIPGPQLSDAGTGAQPPRTAFSKPVEAPPAAAPAPASAPSRSFSSAVPRSSDAAPVRTAETVASVPRAVTPAEFTGAPTRLAPAGGDAARSRPPVAETGAARGGNIPATTRPARDADVLTEIAAYENSRRYRLEQNKINFSTFSGGSPYEKTVTLTFDDGPDPRNTPKILQILHKNKVAGTFFVIGRKVDRYPELVRAMAAQGHDLGNHTYHHFEMTALGDAGVRFEIQRTNQSIERVVGGPTRWFRAPGCRYTPEILQILNDLDMIRVDTTLNSGDWAKHDTKSIVDRIVKDVAPGDVILVHDRLALTVKALPEVIRQVRAKGYRFVPLTTLALRAQAVPGFRPPFWPSHQGIVIDDPKKRAYPGRPKRRVKRRVVPFPLAYNSAVMPEDVPPAVLAKRVMARKRRMARRPQAVMSRTVVRKAPVLMGPPFPLPSTMNTPVKRVLPHSRVAKGLGGAARLTP
jgi:peptidoglycan/xylan/chitin deacetylase (PgdA/CDA1 family)